MTVRLGAYSSPAQPARTPRNMQAPAMAIPFNVERVRIVLSFRRNFRMTNLILVHGTILLKRHIFGRSTHSNLSEEGIRSLTLTGGGGVYISEVAQPGPPWGIKMKITVAAALLLGAMSLATGAGPAIAGETIGVVRSASGDATVTRDENTLPAAPGLKLVVGDILGTGRDGSLGVILRDDSSLSIGPGSRLVLRSFHFSTSEETFDLVVRITRGTMAYLSGLSG